jgi:flagellar biogenesis protein FliO
MHMKRFVFQGNAGPLPRFLDPLGGPDAKRQVWGRSRRSERTAAASSPRKLLQVATALPGSAFAQGAASEPMPSGGLGWFGGELLLLALIAACAWTVIYVLKRKRQATLGGDERVHVLGMTSLGMRERVVVLRVRERTLVVGVTAAQITLLAELDAARDAPPQEAAARAAA